MKYLFVFLLLACGKHEMPGPPDTRDQVQKNFETALLTDKFISDLGPSSDVHGVLSFYEINGPQKLISYELSNQNALTNRTLNLLVDELNLIQKESVLGPRTVLHLKKDTSQTPKFTDEELMVELKFAPHEERPTSLILIDSHQIVRTFKYSHQMNIRLTREELKAVIEGRLKFSLEKKTYKFLLDKTYRVAFHDGFETKIFYVSKEISFEEFLHMKGIQEAIRMDNIFLHTKDFIQKYWWTRDLAGNDKVVALASQSDVQRSFLGKMEEKDFLLHRREGHPENSVSLVKPFESSIYLIVRPALTLRNYKERVQVDRVPGALTCSHKIRDVVSEFTAKLDYKDFITDFLVIMDGREFPLAVLKYTSYEESDEKGVYWRVIIKAEAKNIDLRLKELPQSTFTEVGLIEPGCHGRKRTTLLNNEVRLILDVKAYVEKEG